jgi:DNA polymerase V
MNSEKSIQITDVYLASSKKGKALPQYSGVAAGFPSPADDFLEGRLDLNEKLIRHPAATFFVRVSGNSMIKAGIHSGDMLIVDRSLEPKSGSVVVAVIDGEFTVKRISRKGDRLYLMPENPRFKPIQITDNSSFQVWGVVTNVIHKV